MVKLALVGEAFGKEEEEQGIPFVGASGKVLNGMLAQVGIQRDECFLTNVFNLRPKPSNDIKNLCGSKADGIPGFKALQAGKYVRAEYAKELERLRNEVLNVAPHVVVCLGATPSWALLGTSGISKIRGSTAQSPWGVKCLPTYHPAAVMRDWTLRPIVLADLEKAKREAEFPEIRRPQREIWIEPTIEDLQLFAARFIYPSDELSIDIETIGPIITCIGFAPSKSISLVVPFFDQSRPGHNYWPSFEEERLAWNFVREMCGLTKARYVGQNYLYDMHFLYRAMGITCKGQTDDTMLLSHALQPELPKGLAFLGSIFTDEASWKFMRKVDTVKRED